MKITIPVTTSAKVAEGNPQMIFTESPTKEKAFDREKMTDNQTGLSMSASLNRMSALMQQFWNTPMLSWSLGLFFLFLLLIISIICHDGFC